MDLQIKTAPAVTSIDAALVKASKRILNSSEDTLIDFWIEAADDYIERSTNRALLPQTLVLTLDRVLPVVDIPRPPLASITHVKYTLDGEAEVTLDPADYKITAPNMLSRITIADLSEAKGSMEIEYIAGYADADAVPSSLRQASLLLAGHYLTSREATFLDPRIMNVEKKIEFGVDQNCMQYRVPNASELNDGH